MAGLTLLWRLLASSIRNGEEGFGLSLLDRLRRRNGKPMKISRLRKRLRKNRPMSTISLRMPEDVIEDLKRLAPLLGFSGYQPLIRAYVGQGLRVDLERMGSGSAAAGVH